MNSFLEGDDIENSIVEMKDEEILRASLDEPAMFQVLVDKYREPLFRAAWRVVRAKEEAEDIVQEAFVKIYKNAEKFEKLQGIEFKSWAYKITINTAITHYRKLKKGEFLAEDPGIYQKNDDMQIDEAIHALADAKSIVVRILEQMPNNLRSVLTRYYFEDKSYKTIAEEEKISIATLKMRLFRAKRVFKKIMDNEQFI